jgi:hypothetical protein
LLTLSVGAGAFETEDLFSITLPDGWVRMPDQVLISYAEQMEKAAPEGDASYFDYGFQLADEETPLAYPCVLIQVHYLGRFATGDLERFARNFGGENAHLNDDKTLFTAVQEQDGVKILIGRQLTEYGFIELKGFATADTFDRYAPVFDEAFSNLSLDDRILYQPRITDNAPVVGSINVGKVVVVFIQAAVVGALLWLVYGFIRSKIRRVKNA